jgi:peptidoglycan/xylan/chitin deacetylase (PgdA/CDA1 family)
MSLADVEQGHTYIEEVIEKLKLLPQEQRSREIEKINSGEGARTAAATVDRTMTWQEIERLQAGGVTFGSHTCTHEILTRIPPERAMEEITHSRELIEKRLGAPCLLFAYPNGNSSKQVREMVQRAGYKLAFVNDCPEVWTVANDPCQVPRVNICEYHLIGVDGNFSPLIFEYAVLWSAVKNCWADMARTRLRRLAAKLSLPAEKSGELEAQSKPLTRNSEQ